MATHRWQPFGLDPLIAEAKRRTRRRRSFLAVVLILVALSVSLALGFRPGSRVALPGHDTLGFIGDARVGGLEISIPAGFTHEATTFGVECRRHCQVTLSKGRLPSFDRATNAWAVSAIDRSTSLPSNGVALVFNVWLGTSCAGAGRRPCAPNLRFPVSLNQLGRSTSNTRGGQRRVNVFSKSGKGRGLYEIGVWLGADAPQSDKEAVVSALRSIRVAAK